MALNPRVDISVKTALSLIPNPGEAVGMLVGTAQYGPINEVLTFSNFTSVLEVFQDDKDVNTTITKAAELFFANGGSVLKVLRIADDNKETASIKLDGKGSVSNVIELSAKYDGEYGNQFMVDIDEQGTGRILRVMSGDIIELFNNNGAQNGYTTNQDLVDAINSTISGSQFITAKVNNAALVEETVGYEQLIGGVNGNTAIVAADYSTAFDNLLANTEWDFLMIPNTHQTVSIEDTDQFHTTIVSKVMNRASQHKKYSIYVSGVSLNESIALQQERTTNSERFMLASPSIEHTSRVDGKTEVLDGTYTACCIIGTMCSLDESGGAITRKNINVNDLSVSTLTGKKYYENAEIEVLLNFGICVSSKISGALKYARGITRIKDKTNIYFEANILRIVDKLKTIIQDTLDTYLGEPNTELTRDRMSAVVDGILENSKNQGLLNEYTPTIVTPGVSPDSTNVAINVKPAFAMNFINVVITVN